MRTVTFELYSDELFLEIEIQTSDLDSTLTLLESVPNVRNIQVH